MDDDQLRHYAERARSLAVMADPFIAKRLIELAARYEKRIKDSGQRSTRILAPRAVLGKVA